jgi:hypothetical protein
MAGKKRIDSVAHGACTFAVNDSHVEYSGVEAGFYIIGKEIFNFLGREGVEVQDAVNGQRHRGIAALSVIFSA